MASLYKGPRTLLRKKSAFVKLVEFLICGCFYDTDQKSQWADLRKAQLLRLLINDLDIIIGLIKKLLVYFF